MSYSFANFGEFNKNRGKFRSRFGPRTKAIIITDENKKKKTPEDIARAKLLNLLKDDRTVTIQQQLIYVDRVILGDQIRYMNLPVLAQVILFLINIENKPERINYDNMSLYIERMIPQTNISKFSDSEENNIMRMRMAATFVRYIEYVLKSI